MRQLAHIEKVNAIKPIYLVENDQPADNIELAQVLGWEVVVKKGEYKVGDLAVYIEIDSIVPEIEPFEFLSKRKYRIKTMKLNKFYIGEDKTNLVVSQGLLMQPSLVLPEDFELKEGKDVTKELNITKQEDETPEVRADRLNQRIKVYQQKHWFMKTKFAKWLMKFERTRKILIRLFIPQGKPKSFPSYIVKTDETRIQAIPQVFENWQGKTLQVTEKLDGTSTTFGLQKKAKGFDFAVCSRNVRQLDHNQKTWYTNADSNFYWEMAFKYNIRKLLEHIFKKYNAKNHVVLQGETIGPSIQSNRYKLEERKMYAFNLVIDNKKLDTLVAAEIITETQKEIGNTIFFEWVPILETRFILKETIPEMLKYATADSVLYSTLREGVVIRDAANRVSFKVISPEWLLLHKL